MSTNLSYIIALFVTITWATVNVIEILFLISFIIILFRMIIFKKKFF